MRRGIDAISLWAAVPHYASNAPSPKATLALINTLEEFLNIKIPLSDLPDKSDAWEREVNDLAADDSDIYIDIRNTLVKAKVVKFPFK